VYVYVSMVYLMVCVFIIMWCVSVCMCVQRMFTAKATGFGASLNELQLVKLHVWVSTHFEYYD